MDAKVYSEIFSTLKMLGKKYIDKIPQEIIEIITNKMDKNYQPIYNINNINKANISKEALSIIAYFNINYWYNNNTNDMLIILNED